MKKATFILFCISSVFLTKAQENTDIIQPCRTEAITPLHKTSFNNDGQCKTRIQGGNPRINSNILIFDGAQDGNRQVDPQIAVGGGYVLHGTNSGLIIYNKAGEFVDGVSQKCFNDGIDPKLFFDPHNKVFGFDLWVYWDKEKIKPVNVSISETADPRGAWNTYPVPAPHGVDGGGISYSRKWIGYSFPGGEERTFVLKMSDAKAGKPTTAYHFKGSLGHPVAMQDANDDLYFFEIQNGDFVINKVSADANGNPVAKMVGRKAHNLKFVQYPPQSPQKDSKQLTSSGDRNPKNLVFQNGSIWFSHAVRWNNHSAVQWHQVKPDGNIVQTGLICSDNSNYIQTTLAVNKKNDVLIGFQETNENMFISPRMAFHSHKDKPGVIQDIIKLGEGQGATDGVAWGDYSGTIVDGDNMLDLWTVQSITSQEGKGRTVISKYPVLK